MNAKWKRFDKKELQNMANKVTSNRQWLKQMGYKEAGSNSQVVKDILSQYPDLDISHFKNHGWNKGNNSYDKLSSSFSGKRETIKRALISVRGHQCEICRKHKWNKQLIPLEIHHINGNNNDNDIQNLLLCCPNCHAQTDSYRGKNINHTIEKEISDEEFVKSLQNSKNIRQALISLNLSPKGANYFRAHNLIYKYNIKHLMK